ncbi:MAG: NADH-quinone oxidoreductase subunit NuoE [Actinomycetota bacterium]
MPALSEDSRREAEKLIARYPHSRSALLPLLYLVQAEQGHVTREGMQEVGELLGLTTAEVEAVATYYTMFRKGPTGKWLISVCTNVSCALAGAKKVYERAVEEAGEGASTATPDGGFTVEEVECLAACDAAPVIQVNYCNYDSVSQDRMAEIVAELREDRVPEPARGPKPEPHDRTAHILSGAERG